MAFEQLVAQIRQKTREEWVQYCRDQLQKARTWIQEHGEIAAVIGFAAGMLIVLMFKLVVGVLVIIGLLALIAWLLAHPGKPGEVSNSAPVE